MLLHSIVAIVLKVVNLAKYDSNSKSTFQNLTLWPESWRNVSSPGFSFFLSMSVQVTSLKLWSYFSNCFYLAEILWGDFFFPSLFEHQTKMNRIQLQWMRIRINIAKNFSILERIRVKNGWFLVDLEDRNAWLKFGERC